MNEFSLKNIQSTLLWCVALVAIALIATGAYRNRNRANDIVTVTGLAKRDFDSDLVAWNGRYSRRAPELKKAYEGLRNDTTVVKSFLEENKVEPGEMTFSSVNIEKEYDDVRDKAGNTKRTFKGYLLTQNVRVESKSLDRVETVSRNVTSVIDKGIEFYSDAPQYFYTKLGDLKVEMIAAATQDGRTRAEKISQNAGGKMGTLRFSSLGIFQITRPNTTAEAQSWEGAFDTTSRKKTASVTIKLQFGLL